MIESESITFAVGIVFGYILAHGAVICAVSTNTAETKGLVNARTRN